MSVRRALVLVLLFLPIAGSLFAQALPVDTSIVKTVAPAQGAPGQQFTFTMVVGNAGPSDATLVTVTDPLPAGLTLVSVTPSQGNCTGTTTITCNLGTILFGGNATITLVASAAAAGNYTNTATVASAEGDFAPANNTSSALAAVVAPNPVPALSHLGLGALALLLGAAAIVALRLR